jgi:hypothetical protein
MYDIPKRVKIYLITIKYTKWPQNVPNAVNRLNGHIIYQHLPMQDPPKFTQIGIFGLKLADGSVAIWQHCCKAIFVCYD